MKKAWILMTAIPPTKGHLNLIRFGASLAQEVNVIVCTKKDEPYFRQRVSAVIEATRALPRVRVHHLHWDLPQDPSTPGFWELWQSIMLDHSGIPGLYLFGGVQPGDYIVSSEPYGAKLAELTGGIFMPYDPNRELYYTKATDIRENMEKYFHDIMPTFQRHLMTKVVVFGAESTGKTTLSKELSCSLNAHWLFEYARPYLECVGPAITKDSMRAIWEGQYALEESARHLHDKPYLIQDTDLFSTVGYWEQPHWTESLGAVPKELVYDAQKHKADLYIITKSNIAFEQDPIR